VFSRVLSLLKLFVGKIVVIDLRAAHLINGLLPVSNQIVAIGIEFIPSRIVVPGSDVENRPCRQQRLIVFVLKINQMPRKLILVYAAQHGKTRAGSAWLTSGQAHPCATCRCPQIFVAGMSAGLHFARRYRPIARASRSGDPSTTHHF